MAPLVWGERETMDNMLWYSLVLLALTVLPVSYGAFGLIYLVSALSLGIPLVLGILRMRRAQMWTARAWWVYKYSLLYLALLFVAMALDRRILP
jgi:protoheme IX farnesyltransferase